MHLFTRAAKARSAQPSWAVRLLFSLAVTSMLASCGVSATGGWHEGVPGRRLGQDTTLNSPHGPLYPADVKLLVAVAQAGLWEAPASEDVARRTTNPKVRKVAEQLAKEHHALHETNIAAATRVQVQLPHTPTPQQKGWQDTIRSSTGDDLDRVYVNLTRAAHGSVYMAIATVRSTTQNDVIRSMATIAEDYVARHMALLESTGLADHDALAVHSGTDARYQSVPGPFDFALGIGLALAVAFATLLVVRMGSRMKPIHTAEEEEEAVRWNRPA